MKSLPEHKVVGDEMEADPERCADLFVGGKGGGALNGLEDKGLDGQDEGHAKDCLGPEHIDVGAVRK